MNISNLFGLLAGIFALVTYYLYFMQTVNGKSTPNPSSWAIWLIVGIINAITFFSLTSNNWWQSFIVIAVTSCVSVVFIYSLFKGKFSRISRIEILLFMLAFTIGVFWKITSDYRASNLLLQVIYAISFIPTINGIIKGTSKEQAAAWVVALFTYSFSILSIIFSNNFDWIALVHPIVNGLVGNGVVVWLIMRKKSKIRKY